jgi:ribonuclease E
MPNTARGGGVSRKITSAPDRKRLKVIIEDLEIPQGMAVIVRTAGSERNKTEIKRDYEYLLRLWDEIRELTLRSVAPALVYEEANLIKRSIRDLYSRDIDDITVEGDEGYKLAKAFMRTLTPSHAKRVQAYRDPAVPLFQRHQVESQLDAIHNPVVHLKSGGYVVINSTEALVAIDVNSGRSTRERNIEETALRTNLEASDEVARQLRLRDLAGLIVIDYIDMEESRHNAMVERRLKEAMRHDRARIQLGRISHFGLLELSRQRLRPSLFESSMEVCRHCHGTGHIRSVESTALHVLRSIEEEGMRHRSAAITVAVPTAVALYIFNQKRFALGEIEARHSFRIYLTGDDTLIPPEMRVERIKALEPGELPRQPVSAPLVIEEEPEEPVAEDSEAEAESESESETEPEAVAAESPAPAEENGRGRRRSRRRGRRDGDRRDGDRRDGDRRDGDRDRRPPPPRVPETAESPESVAAELGMGAAEDNDDGESPEAPPPGGGPSSDGDRERRRRRRGKRGGRRRSRRPGEPGAPEGGAGVASAADNGAGEQPAYDYGAVYDDYPAANFEPADVTPASEADAPADIDQPLPAAEPLSPPPPETIHPPEEEPAAAPAASSVEHREVNGAATVEPSPAPVETPPPAEPAAPSGPPRRGWWKRLVE